MALFFQTGRPLAPSLTENTARAASAPSNQAVLMPSRAVRVQAVKRVFTSRADVFKLGSAENLSEEKKYVI